MRLRAFVLVLFASFLVCGCYTQDRDMEKHGSGTFGKVDYSGHAYVVWTGHDGQGSMVHDSRL